MGPVQTMADHRAIVPVEGVDNPWGAIDIPAVQAVVLEKFLRVRGEPARSEHAGAYPCRFEVQQ
ncbi:hypothetical protein D3C78_1922840 [compost metagenome]